MPLVYGILIAFLLGIGTAFGDLTSTRPMKSLSYAKMWWILFLFAHGMIAGIICLGLVKMNIMDSKAAFLSAGIGYPTLLKSTLSTYKFNSIEIPISFERIYQGILKGFNSFLDQQIKIEKILLYKRYLEKLPINEIEDRIQQVKNFGKPEEKAEIQKALDGARSAPIEEKRLLLASILIEYGHKKLIK